LAWKRERKKLLGLVFETVVVDVAEGRLICMQSKAPCVALIRQVPGLQHIPFLTAGQQAV
jgi:hypothetical protein